ncbi:MAG: Holliday junction ATP-dependent DNA helicase RuvA [Phycisphaerae bacterium]|nr:MAG: Holliday junction ATP-dependent DNA helicase RuvA [Phycisphaerae bacterium]
MITRITGRLEQIVGHEAEVAQAGGEVVRQVLVPAYWGASLSGRVGQVITLWTLEYLESPNQGATFTPRMLGFPSAVDRRFFELLTTVKGIGPRKALRALAVEPAEVAGAIRGKDTRALTRLPEIGKRLAETMILELGGKVEAFLPVGEAREMTRAAGGPVGDGAGDPMTSDAVEALVALGEPRAEAELLVSRARGRAQREGRRLVTVEAILDMVFAGRAG